MPHIQRRSRGMNVLIAYDVATKDAAGRRRLRKIAQACENCGQRVQYSLFEVSLDRTRWTELRLKLLDLANPEKDSLRFYFVDNDAFDKTEHHGVRAPRDFEEPMVI
jgi:CRISPR-associated protein Cas2